MLRNSEYQFYQGGRFTGIVTYISGEYEIEEPIAYYGQSFYIQFRIIATI